MAVMRADLEVTERWCHRYTVAYCPDGEDATVSYGSKDFKFKNNTDYPIKLKASLDGSYVNVNIYGTKTQNKSVRIYTEKLEPDVPYEKLLVMDETLAPEETREGNQAGHPGRRTVTYRIVTIDGVEKKKLENYSTYTKLDVITYISKEAAATTTATTVAGTNPQPQTTQPPATTAAPPATTTTTPPATTTVHQEPDQTTTAATAPTWIGGGDSTTTAIVTPPDNPPASSSETSSSETTSSSTESIPVIIINPVESSSETGGGDGSGDSGAPAWIGGGN